jgi:lipoprotein-releasing system ATP-binding protein
MTIHLSANGLEKSYRKGKNAVSVLTNVDLEVEHGELVAVVGASGSGKSTLLHLLGLLDVPDSGSVVLDGERIDNVRDRRRDELRNQTFGFIFQFYHLLPELSALENVMTPHLIRLGVAAYWQNRRRLRAEAAAILDRVGLGHRLRHRPSELSGGELQRAAIARALCGGPSILLADEPTGNLDAGTGQGVIELLRDLNRERELTMIMVTHDAQIAQQADRTVRLVEGRIEEWSPLAVASASAGPVGVRAHRPSPTVRP